MRAPYRWDVDGKGCHLVKDCWKRTSEARKRVSEQSKKANEGAVSARRSEISHGRNLYGGKERPNTGLTGYDVQPRLRPRETKYS